MMAIWFYKPNDTKGALWKMNKQCRVCKRSLTPNSFWKHKVKGTYFLINKKFTTYHTCKECCLKNIDPKNSETFLSILEEMDIPYFQMVYEEYLNSTNPLGKYLARMRLGNLYDLEYKDTKRLNEGYKKNE